MRVLLIEDDVDDAKGVTTSLADLVPSATVQTIKSAYDFRSHFDDIAGNPPDVIILDVLLPWAALTTSAPPVPEYYNFYRGGLDCLDKLRSDDRTRRTPVIIRSVLERHDLGDTLPANVVSTSKSKSMHDLVQCLRSVLPGVWKKGELRSSVFVVHGHDSEAKEAVARFMERLGFVAIILHEQPNRGRAILDKFEEYSNVAFAIVLLTPDDLGGTKKNPKALRPRARQNVICELGFLVAKLGRNRVCALSRGDIEIPSDYAGVLYLEMDVAGAWRAEVAAEMRAAGLEFDFNRILSS